MTERKKLEFISSVEIMNTPMKKQRFIVAGMIYPGIHILSGDPKIGKSWMMMDMCLAVAKGEKFLGRKTERGQVVYMALEDTFISLQSRMYELTDEPSENLTFTLLANSIGSGLEEDLRDCKKMFPNLKMVVIDTLQKIRNNIDTKYGADYQELSVLKSIADQLEIAIVLVHHNRKAHDSNPNNLISGTNGIAGCADGLLVFTRNGENAKLHISGRGAPSLELNLKRENAKWILLDDAPESKPDIFSFMIHDFLIEKISVNGTASEICSMLKEKYPQQEFNCNWLYRDLLQHDDEIRTLGIDYGKTKSNGIRSILIHYNADRDSSGGKILCTENSVPVDPESATNADDYLHEVDCVEFPNTENAVPAVPENITDTDSKLIESDSEGLISKEGAVSDEENKGNAFIAMAAEMMRRSIAKQEIIVPAFSAD